IPFGPTNAAREPYRSFIAAQKDIAFYNEPSGGWMISKNAIRAAHDRYRSTAAADDLAWYLVNNGLGGECEGDIACYAAAANQLEGDYLRLHPAGRHADEALRSLTQ